MYTVINAKRFSSAGKDYFEQLFCLNFIHLRDTVTIFKSEAF